MSKSKVQRPTRGAWAAIIALAAASGLVVPASGATAEPAAPELGAAQTFTYTGAPQSVAVPARAVAVHITAVGGSGGSVGGLSFTAGSGDKKGGVVPLTAGTTQLQVNVGGNGTNGGSAPGTGGWNGGGAGGTSTDGHGAGGGGASDVRTGPDAFDRIFVAAGGGGAGGVHSPSLPGSGGAGGAAGFAGTTGSGANSGGGGGAGLGNAGGGGGTPAATPPGAGAGALGTLAAGGGGGASTSSGGGGGGGGRYGGGGGGGGQVGGGGGGGLSYSAGTIETSFTVDSTPRVTLQFELAPLDLLTCPALSLTVGQDIGITYACTTKGQPVPSVDYSPAELPPGLGAGLVLDDPAILYLYGAPTRTGHFSTPITATVGGERQTVILEVQVDPPALGHQPGGGSSTTTTMSTTTVTGLTTTTGGGGSAGPLVPVAVPTYTG